MTEVATELKGFRDRLEALAEDVGGTTALAVSMGVSPSKIYAWLRGQYTPTVDGLVQLAEATGVSLNWLLLGEGSKTRTRNLTQPQGTTEQ